MVLKSYTHRRRKEIGAVVVFNEKKNGSPSKGSEKDGP